LTARRGERAQQKATKIHSAIDDMSKENASTTVVAGDDVPSVTDGAGQLEEEAAGEGAFNPETGEINWDCPCLGGMAHGPCGPEFREAFSCFVFSEEEPKGMDCIDKFQNMQKCFQAHPEVYKGELEDDDEMDAALEDERQELVSEIAARKKQDAAGAEPKRLLEEPDTISKPTRKPKRAPSDAPAESAPSAASPEPTLSESEPQALPRAASGAGGSEASQAKFSKDGAPTSTTSPLQGSTSDPDIVPKAAFSAVDDVGPAPRPDADK
jgi:mitochondrial intermembrane space import and assembly protein 40